MAASEVLIPEVVEVLLVKLDMDNRLDEEMYEESDSSPQLMLKEEDSAIEVCSVDELMEVEVMTEDESQWEVEDSMTDESLSVNDGSMMDVLAIMELTSALDSSADELTNSDEER